MTHKIFAIGALLFLTASGVGLIACAGDTEDTTGEGEDDIKKNGAGLGATCDASRKCKTGLLCKNKKSGPPAGAVGLPLPPSTSSGSGGPPPGAMGMPARPEQTCQNPDPGEEGGSCSPSVPCQAGLECKYASGGGGMPPGAMGMPAPRQGTCQKKSSGPPPGAVGLPLPPGG